MCGQLASSSPPAILTVYSLPVLPFDPRLNPKVVQWSSYSLWVTVVSRRDWTVITHEREPDGMCKKTAPNTDYLASNPLLISQNRPGTRRSFDNGRADTTDNDSNTHDPCYARPGPNIEDPVS